MGERAYARAQAAHPHQSEPRGARQWEVPWFAPPRRCGGLVSPSPAARRTPRLPPASSGTGLPARSVRPAPGTAFQGAAAAGPLGSLPDPLSGLGALGVATRRRASVARRFILVGTDPPHRDRASPSGSVSTSCAARACSPGAAFSARAHLPAAPEHVLVRSYRPSRSPRARGVLRGDRR